MAEKAGQELRCVIIIEALVWRSGICVCCCEDMIWKFNLCGGKESTV